MYLRQLMLSLHICWCVGNTKRRYHNINNGYHKNANNGKIVDAICFADMLLVFHVIATIPNETDTNSDLQSDTHRYERQTEVVVRMSSV